MPVSTTRLREAHGSRAPQASTMWRAAIAAGAVQMVVFLTLLVGAGAFFIHATLARFLNSTAVEVGGGRGRVKHGPLRWPGGVDLASAGLVRLRCFERRRRNGGQRLAHEARAQTAAGTEHVLLTSLPRADHVLFIEQQLEHHLEIADHPVVADQPW